MGKRSVAMKVKNLNPAGSRALTYFEAVVRFGSMRKAATALFVASSALNRQILDLEANLGVQLFERLPRGIRLTSAGEILIGHVRRVMRDFTLTCSQIEDLRGLRGGHVRLAVIEAAGGVISKLVSAFQRTHPRLTFDCHVLGSHEVVSAVVRGQADIGYVFNPPPDPGFKVIAETPVPLHVIMSRGHPLAAHQSLRLSDCVGYPTLLGDESLGGRHLINAAAEEISLSLRPVVTSNSVAVLKRIVAAGQCLCFQIDIDPEDEPGLVAVPLSDARLSGRLAIGVKKGRALQSPAAVFLEELTADLARRTAKPIALGSPHAAKKRTA
jgi:DNA-binding transcriptional LysR family regulator